jgi:hexosaminidase
VHLDLKGLPPTAHRLVELLKLFAAARYNVVLVEWEDSFPWTVDERFRSPTAYRPADIRQFTETARALGLELIPLVQCLGHMETPLSVPDYEHLRELPDQAASLDPLNPDSRQLIQRMVDDVLKLMPETRYFHLGGDESWTFGKSPATRAYVEKHGKGALHLAHVEPILDALRARGIRPILWHDMMIDSDSQTLKFLAAKSDLMSWGYIGHPDTSGGQHATEYYRRIHQPGIVLSGATAYKGCAAETVERHTSDRPELRQREENALAWTEIAERFNYAGVVATAWSRWSVDTLQCVPIDAALAVALGVHAAGWCAQCESATNASAHQAGQCGGASRRCGHAHAKPELW